MLVRIVQKGDHSPGERAFIIVLALVFVAVFTGIGLCAIINN